MKTDKRQVETDKNERRSKWKRAKSAIRGATCAAVCFMIFFSIFFDN